MWSPSATPEIYRRADEIAADFQPGQHYTREPDTGLFHLTPEGEKLGLQKLDDGMLFQLRRLWPLYLEHALHVRHGMRRDVHYIVSDGRIIALNDQAGYQATLLRGGLHFGYWSWQYRIHIAPLVTVPQGQIGYLYARDGLPLPPSQTLGRVVECGNFQDAQKFLVRSGEEAEHGQRGR